MRNATLSPVNLICCLPLLTDICCIAIWFKFILDKLYILLSGLLFSFGDSLGTDFMPTQVLKMLKWPVPPLQEHMNGSFISRNHCGLMEFCSSWNNLPAKTQLDTQVLCHIRIKRWQKVLVSWEVRAATMYSSILWSKCETEWIHSN